MEQKTTLKLGFDADLRGLKRVDKEVQNLKKSFDQLTQSAVKAGNQKTDIGIEKSISPIRQKLTGSQSQPDHVKPVNSLTRSIGGAKPLGPARLARSGGAGLMTGLGMMPGIGIAAGAAGLAFGVSKIIGDSIREAKDYRITLDGVFKTLHVGTSEQERFNAELEQTAHALGMTRKELAPLEKQYLSMAGAVQGINRIQGHIRGIGGLAKGFGIDPGHTMQQFGHLAQSGAYGALGGPRGLQMRDMAMLITDAVSRGQMKGREGELIQSIDSLVGVQLQTLTRPENVGGMIKAMAGMSATGQPGLMGMRGAQLLGRVSAGIRNPGGGDFGDYFAYQAFGGGDYYKFKKRQEEGAFGEGNNLSAMMTHFQKNFSDANSRHYAMSKVLGVSMHQAEALEKGMVGMRGQQGQFVDMLRNAAGGGQRGAERLERLDFAKLPILGELSQAKSPEKIRSILNDERIQLDSKKIQNIMQSADPQLASMKAVIEANLQQTEGEAIQSEMSKLSDTLTGIGDRALPALVKTLEITNTGLGKVSDGIEKVVAIFTPDTRQAKPVEGYKLPDAQKYLEHEKQRQQDQQQNPEVTVNHQTLIYLDGVERKNHKSKSVGNGTASKVYVGPVD